MLTQNQGDLCWVSCWTDLPWHRGEEGAQKQREGQCKTASIGYKREMMNDQNNVGSRSGEIASHLV